MNSLIKHSDLSHLGKYFSILDSITNHEHEQKYDARVKWASILKSIDELKIRPKRILDAGCGKSHLALAIDKMLGETLEEIFCIDLISPINSLKEDARCKFEVLDFFESSKKLENDYFDLILDGCAVTHFDVNSTMSNNDGCARMGEVAMRILKLGGHLVCSSDVLSFNDENISGEFISIRSMENSYRSGGLCLLGEIDDNKEDCFLIDYYAHGAPLAIANLVFRK